VIPHGTAPMNRGLAVGQIIGGIFTMVGGATGEVLGGAASATGIGAAIGVPAMVVSTTLVVGGAANVAAGFRGLVQSMMSSGSGSGGSGAPAPKGGANPATRAAAARGSTLHADKPGHLPDQLRSRFPQTEFEFAKPGQPRQDVRVVGGKHPSEYPGSSWPQGVDHGDFKPATPSGARTFVRDQSTKWAQPTHMLPYEPTTGNLR
jgi:hypothetical protein